LNKQEINNYEIRGILLEREITMKNGLFKDLISSIKEGGKLLSGKIKPVREFNLKSPDPKKIKIISKNNHKKI
jgi:hypothetical protein